MLLEALSSAILGLALALGAYRRLSHRLPAPVLVLPTGVAGALFGAFVMNTALDAGNLLTMLLGAAIVSVASLSLLLRPAGRLRRSATA
ncbi:hypothetical protein HTV80_02780 [Streptomyces sp. Vc74B-19]|uniref:hypothetical protein n=1 Tax=unclassified Streptomyces TaxID=2593676 RepID=UPI000463EDCD|nr:MULTISPECIES: hypothetical protein [unclassified Streptomyces]MBT3162037.1 hypothetical protein [Streptomyces sp. Vc74B-19]MCO4697679.1 hypothetical protein [Streptomyces sp. RO-S4]MDU0299743.1 hypothetical protein [Streptomyces sp. PAL114]